MSNSEDETYGQTENYEHPPLIMHSVYAKNT